jgi:twitching motility protein PilT
LVCGASGSGKTTTLAALINFLNETRQAHLLTLEDPIEYLHRSRRCLVNQRELNTHTDGYAAARRGALRQDPDVIVIGDLKDPETIKLALEASETGHLVIGTLNCTRAETAIQRIVGAFEPDEQAQARIALSDALKAILAQTLLPRADETGMVAVYEVIVGLHTISTVIRDDKPHLISSLMQTGKAHGMQTFDDALLELVRGGTVTPEVAYQRANSKELFAPMLGEAAKE